MAIAYVLINCDVGYEDDVKEHLKSIEHVKEVQGTIGAYDIVAKIEVDPVKTLREIITSKIRRIDRIVSTLTIMCIDGQSYVSNS